MKQIVSPASFYGGKDFFRKESLPLKILHMDSSINYPFHSHDFTELVIVYSGEAIHQVESSLMKVKTGSVLLIPKRMGHSYTNVMDFSYINVIFDSEIIFDKILTSEFYFDIFKIFYKSKDFRFFHLATFELKKILSLANCMDRELFRGTSTASVLSISYFLQFLSSLYEVLIQGVREGTSTEERIEEIIIRIKNNVSENLSIENLSEMACTSPRNFRRVFKRMTGSTPSRFIHEIRLQESCALLLETDLTITQIALLVGFDDPNHYSHSFRSYKGISPSFFRQRGIP